MNSVNLIPLARVEARRRAARIRAWMMAAPLCVSLLAGMYGWLRATWDTNTAPLVAQLSESESKLQASERAIAAARKGIAELQPALRAARVVAGQPDWGLLLGLLAQNLRDDAVLRDCVLEPVAEGPVKGGKGREAGRPGRFLLKISGLAKGQEGLASLVQRLESAGVFDGVTILEARRTTLADQEAVGFRVECLLTDPVTEGR